MSEELTNADALAVIIALRGGVPSKCDFCGQERLEEQLHPEEAGDWVCEECLKAWGELDER